MRALVDGARVARLGTLNESGGVDLVPVTFAVDGETFVTAVDRKPKRSTRLARLANVRREPRVTVLVDHYDDREWSALWWVRLRGRARVVDPDEDAAGHAEAVAPLVRKYAQYRDEPPEGPAIVVDIEQWRGWSAGGG